MNNIQRSYFIGFRRFNKADEKRTFNLYKDNFNLFFGIVECDKKILTELLKEARGEHITLMLTFRLPNCWASYFIFPGNKVNIKLASIEYIY